MSVAVLGAGAFGTALALSLAEKEPVILWCRSQEQAADMQTRRENSARLPGVALPDQISVTDNFLQAADVGTILLAVPMQKLRALLTEHAKQLSGRVLVACCKGVELKSHLGPLAIIAECTPNTPSALLTGPSFAHDIARGLPTALTLACSDPGLAQTLQHDLSTSNLRLYRTTDTVGAELGGALKNVFAIACGAVIGAGLGDSARAALMTRGYAEMQRMALALGANQQTLAGLSGFGDLALTCTSDKSRNYQFGLALGRGQPFDPNVTVEGAATSIAVSEKAREMSLDMPITDCVTGLVNQNITIREAMEQLLSRPLKEE